MINNVVIMGRLVAAPELKSTPNGTHVTGFTLAVERAYKSAGEERKTDFIDCVAWRGTADFITQWFYKGDMIAITGTIQTRNYEDKNGNKRKAVEIVVDSASFCGGKKDDKTNINVAPPPPSTVDNSDFEVIDDDDDLPF